MSAQAPELFKHTTLKVAPETPIFDSPTHVSHWTPKAVGYVLLDEESGFTGIYVRDENGGLWPARTVDHTAPHYHSVCNSWMKRPGAIDNRTIVPPDHGGDVPHLIFFTTVDELHNHYAVYGGTVTQGNKEFIVRLPERKRIHFYVPDDEYQNHRSYRFKSEGYYDEHSRDWIAPTVAV